MFLALATLKQIVSCDDKVNIACPYGQGNTLYLSTCTIYVNCMNDGNSA
jgi:hypothetical protein